MSQQSGLTLNNSSVRSQSQSYHQETFSYPALTKITDYQPSNNFIFRICLLGESGVGKTSLLTRYCDGTFKQKHCSTVGVDFRVVTLKYQEQIAKVHIWDTAGQERFKSIAVTYLKSANGFIFIYDITNEASFKNVSNWIELAVGNNSMSVVNFLVGNKSDDKTNRKVTVQQGEELAQTNNLVFFETSAFKDSNVDRMFEYLTYKMIEHYNNSPDTYDSGMKNAVNAEKMQEIQTTREKDKKCAC